MAVNACHPFTDMTSRSNEDRKLFIGRLNWDTDENDLHEYFKKFGNVIDVSIKYDAVSGNPRGFGFITFASSDSIDEILRNGPHVIKGKAIDPKRAKSRPVCKKIFVGGVDSNMSEEEIRDYFSKFGAVEGIELPFDRQRNRRREFCFIIFNSEEAAEIALKEPKQIIGNKECDIKKAQPQNMAQQQKRIQQQNGGYEGFEPRRSGAGGSRQYQSHGNWDGYSGGRRGQVQYTNSGNWNGYTPTRRDQDQYTTPGNWNGYSGPVSQNYYIATEN